MRKFALATASVAALALSVPAFTAPAAAQDVKVKIGEGRHHGDHDRMRHRNVSKTVVIKHGDRGRHEGWSHSRHYGASKKVIIKHGGGGKTVIKKKFEG